jgi:hypothetical protein
VYLPATHEVPYQGPGTFSAGLAALALCQMISRPDSRPPSPSQHRGFATAVGRFLQSAPHGLSQTLLWTFHPAIPGSDRQHGRLTPDRVSAHQTGASKTARRLPELAQEAPLLAQCWNQPIHTSPGQLLSSPCRDPQGQRDYLPSLPTTLPPSTASFKRGTSRFPRHITRHTLVSQHPSSGLEVSLLPSPAHASF